jgi:D-3-phosphoglycerate dehydrogenase
MKGELRLGTFPTRGEILDFARPADVFLTDAIQWDASMFAELEHLKMVVTYASGYDMIPVQAATEARVIVAYTPLYCVEEVADLAVGLLLVCSRRIAQLDRRVRQGLWGKKIVFSPPLRRLSLCTLGIMGLGHIGTRVCARAKALGMRVLAWDPWITNDQVLERGALGLVDLDTLLAESDYLSLHLRLGDRTRHILGRSQFHQMKPTAYLINTARGGLVDESALVEALDQGLLAGAALDTIDPEPPRSDNPLLKMSNVVITAHSGSVGEEASRDRQAQVAESFQRFSQGIWPKFVANPSVVPKVPLSDLR